MLLKGKKRYLTAKAMLSFLVIITLRIYNPISDLYSMDRKRLYERKRVEYSK